MGWVGFGLEHGYGPRGKRGKAPCTVATRLQPHVVTVTYKYVWYIYIYIHIYLFRCCRCAVHAVPKGSKDQVSLGDYDHHKESRSKPIQLNRTETKLGFFFQFHITKYLLSDLSQN